MERERVREKEPVQKDQGEHYETTLKLTANLRERARTGKIVIKANERPWYQCRQGLIKQYLSWHDMEDSAVTDWSCFVHDIKRHSGKHKHQGGFNLFVLEGEGITEVDDQTVEWEKWDLILLPVKPGGCVHKHYNKVEGKPAKWMAFKYNTFSQVLGSMFEQVENSPDYKGGKKASSV
jgi:hypothetical protein